MATSGSNERIDAMKKISSNALESNFRNASRVPGGRGIGRALRDQACALSGCRLVGC